MDIRDYMKDNILLFDGAMGTMLQKKGLKIGENTEIFGVKNKEILIDIHKQYLDSGANIITTNTFGLTNFNLENSEYTVEELTRESINIAKEAIRRHEMKNNKYIAMSIGPTGLLLKSNDSIYRKQISLGVNKQIEEAINQNIDLILIETMIDINEANLIIDIIKKLSDIPIFCTFTFGKDNKVLSGNNIKEVLWIMNNSNIDATGVNCSYGPLQVETIACEMIRDSSIAIVAQPNLGIPSIINGKPVYDIKYDEFYGCIDLLLKKGINGIGGCCGTTPKHIENIGKMIY